MLLMIWVAIDWLVFDWMIMEHFQEKARAWLEKRLDKKDD